MIIALLYTKYNRYVEHNIVNSLLNVRNKYQEAFHADLKSRFYFSDKFELYEIIAKNRCLRFYILLILCQTAELRN